MGSISINLLNKKITYIRNTNKVFILKSRVNLIIIVIFFFDNLLLIMFLLNKKFIKRGKFLVFLFSLQFSEKLLRMRPCLRASSGRNISLNFEPIFSICFKGLNEFSMFLLRPFSVQKIIVLFLWVSYIIATLELDIIKIMALF